MMELRSIRRKKTNTAAEDEALIEVLIKVKIEEQTKTSKEKDGRKMMWRSLRVREMEKKKKRFIN